MRAWATRIVADLAVVANVVLWVGVIALAALVYALTRQLQSLHRRIAPAGALSVNQALKVGARAPGFTLETLAGGSVAIAEPGLRQLLFFLAPDCPISRSMLPLLRSVRRDEGDVALVLASDGEDRAQHVSFVAEMGLNEIPYVVSEELGRAYGVSKVPYAVLIDSNGHVGAMGIVNSREHLESLFQASELGVGSIQDYLAQGEGSQPRYFEVR
jgi:methylamine dehydrogenase accessory protein MauD